MKMLHRMGKQNVAIRGHTDERSNFTVFLNAQAEFYKILAAHLTKVANKKKHTGKRVQGSYVSHRIQEEFIQLIGDYLEERVLDRVRKAMFFAIMADERRSISRKYSVHEDFTQFLHCHRMSGAALFHLLMGGEDGGYMGRKKIDLSKGRGQAYDGGGNMAGKHNGLQAHVARANPKFLFVHCHGHIMNLCLSKAGEQTQKVVDHVQQITIAFEYSSKRQQFFREAIQANPEAADPLGNKKKISMLCETRWSARGDSFSTVKNGIFPLVSSLEKLEEEKDEQAPGLLAVILEFPFVVTIVILDITECISNENI